MSAINDLKTVVDSQDQEVARLRHLTTEQSTELELLRTNVDVVTTLTDGHVVGLSALDSRTDALEASSVILLAWKEVATIELAQMDETVDGLLGVTAAYAASAVFADGFGVTVSTPFALKRNNDMVQLWVNGFTLTSAAPRTGCSVIALGILPHLNYRPHTTTYGLAYPVWVRLDGVWTMGTVLFAAGDAYLRLTPVAGLAFTELLVNDLQFSWLANYLVSWA